MPAPQYVCDSEGDVALTAATAKTVVGAKAHANSGLLWVSFTVSLDGTSAAAVPALVEPCYCTWATNSPGTNSTSTTARQILGRVLTAGFTCGKTWSAEPTALTPAFPAFRLNITGIPFTFPFPLGAEPDSALAEGFALRLTCATTPNVRAGIVVSRI
jgi:hypothetical protein